MRVIGLAGWSGAGKTTLVAKLIPELRARGVSVSTLKHAHHGFDVDRPGKDSYEHRAAGAHEVLVSSARRWALVHEIRDREGEAPLHFLLRRLSPVDLVLVEGFKARPHPKIGVHRAANGKPSIVGAVPNVVALATDDIPPASDIPVVHLDDVPGVADLALRLALPLDEVLALLEGA